MDKEFEKFRSRVKKEREDLPSRAKIADWIVEESLRWVARRSVADVSAGLGISKASIHRWLRRSESMSARADRPPSAPEYAAIVPPVVNVTRITVGASQGASRVLARLVRGEISIEFLDEGALARLVEGVLS